MKIKLFEDFNDQSYFYVGNVNTYPVIVDLSEGQIRGGGLDQSARVHPSAFQFRKIKRELNYKLTNVVKDIFKDKRYYFTNEIDTTSVFRLYAHLNPGEYDIMIFEIKTMDKKFSIFVMNGSDDYLFVSFTFSVWGKPKKIGADYCWIDAVGEDVKQHESYICDMAYINGFKDLLQEVTSRFNI